MLWLALGALYTRGYYGLGHVYIGHGQPVALRVALGIIETLSGCFRSVSLSLRVVCNATAGHVLLAVLVEMTSVACSSPRPLHHGYGYGHLHGVRGPLDLSVM